MYEFKAEAYNPDFKCEAGPITKECQREMEEMKEFIETLDHMIGNDPEGRQIRDKLFEKIDKINILRGI